MAPARPSTVPPTVPPEPSPAVTAVSSATSVAGLAVLTAAAFAYVTAETLPIGLLTPIADGLGTSPSAVGLLVTGYGLVVVATSIPLTALTRRLPRRPLMTALLGAFTLATVLSAVADSYPVLLAGRLVTALAQALFWSIVGPTVAALFPPATRGRAVAALYASGSLAAVAGVPALTWLGQTAGWRVAFLALAGLGLALTAGIALLLPGGTAQGSSAARGTAPDRRRYRLVLATTALAITGSFTAFTFVAPFLTGVTGLGDGALGPVLLLRGLAGVVGVVMVGLVADRRAQAAMTAAVAVQAVALVAQYVAAGSVPVVVTATAVGGFTLAAFGAVLGARTLQLAPGDTDLAAAGTSTAFNVGITAGALAGSTLAASAGVRSVAAVGAVFSLAALATVLAEGRGGHHDDARRGRRRLAG